MGQAAKYALLGAAIVAVLASAALIIIQFANPSLISGIQSNIASGVSALASFFQNARGLINYFLGGSTAATAFNVLLFLNISFPVAIFVWNIAITIYRWMNQ